MATPDLIRQILEDAAADADFRKEAMVMFKSLHAFLQTVAGTDGVTRKSVSAAYRQKLTPTRKGEFALEAREIDSEYSGLLFLLVDSKASSPGFGHAAGRPVIVLPVLKAPGSLEYVDTRFSGMENVFLHEFIHYLDTQRRKGSAKGGTSARALKSGGYEAYANTPAEMNAFYQEGANKAMGLLRTLLKALQASQQSGEDPKGHPAWGMIKDALRSFPAFQEFALRHGFTKDWVESLTPDNRKRFLKRMSGLYQLAKDEVNDNGINL